jgi:RimJ/RimL family protein N-acetyltransferase
MFGPVIQGKLVRLRPPKAEEAAEIVTWFEDLEVTHFLKRRVPPTLEEEKEFLERVGRDANVIWWGVEHEGRLVGGTSIVDIDWKDGSGRTGTLIGVREVWGRGLGRELMQLRAEYAFTQLPLRKLKSGYLEGNLASARAQAAAGYREVGRWHKDKFFDGEWHDHVLTELMREDWEQARIGR